MYILPDNVARVLDNESKDFKVHVNPHFEKISLIRQKKDALLSIRLTLGIEKLVGPMIKKSKLLQIINVEKERINDDRVKAELDSVFAEYFPAKQELPTVPTAKDVWDKNSPVLNSSVEERINKELMSLEEMEDSLNDTGPGKAKVKSDSHYRSRNPLNGDITNSTW